MFKMKTNKFLLIFIVIFNYCLSEDGQDVEQEKTIINHDWKLNVVALGNGMLPIGQFENNKPFKALSLMVMRHYWLNEYKNSKNTQKISERNRSFWWLLILNFYGLIDSYVDHHLEDFPENIINDKEVESK